MKTGLMSVLFVAVVAGATLFLTLSGYEIPGNGINETYAADAPSVEEILDRYVEAVGGREAVKRLTTRICIGREITDLSSSEHPIYERHHFEAFMKIPHSYYTETWTDAEDYVRAFDGTTGWIKDRCGVHMDEHANKRQFDWLMNPQFALRVRDYFPDLTFVGTQKVRGYTVYVLESPAVHGPLFFDTESGLLIGFGHNWEIHDYREIDGVLYPHKIHISRKSGSTVYEFDRVEHNVAIADSLFTMPAGPF